MPKPIQYRFDPGTTEYDMFVKMWNSRHKKQDIADYFGVSIPTVKRVAKRLQLPKKNDYKNHPYLSHLDKRIKKMYLKGYSTLSIAKAKKINDETVRNHLRRMGIQLRPNGTKNVLYNEYGKNCRKHNLTPTQLRDTVKKLHEQGYWPYQIAQATGADKETVMRRIRAMGERPKGGVLYKGEDGRRNSGRKKWTENM